MRRELNCLCYSLLVYRVFVQRSAHPSLTTYHNIINACIWGCLVHSSRHLNLTGVLCLCTGVFIYFYGDLCPKLWSPQPNWLDIFVYGDLCPKLWTPQPSWLDIYVFIYLFIYNNFICREHRKKGAAREELNPNIRQPYIFVYENLCPKLWTPQPSWLDIFLYGDLRPKFWTPQPNWLDIFVYGNSSPKL